MVSIARKIFIRPRAIKLPIRLLSLSKMLHNRCFKKSWTSILENNKSKFDLSSIDFDGSHTSAIRGGEDVEYQGRKKTKNN